LQLWNQAFNLSAHHDEARDARNTTQEGITSPEASFPTSPRKVENQVRPKISREKKVFSQNAESRREKETSSQQGEDKGGGQTSQSSPQARR
jgi:hypothetical protein